MNTGHDKRAYFQNPGCTRVLSAERLWQAYADPTGFIGSLAGPGAESPAALADAEYVYVDGERWDRFPSVRRGAQPGRVTGSRAAAEVAPSTDDLDELYERISAPASPERARAAAAALCAAAREDEREIDGRFVAPLRRLLARPGIGADLEIVRCLGYISTTDPEAVRDAYDEIRARISLDDSSLTAAAVACCAALADLDSATVLDLAPMAAALLDSEAPPIRGNAITILSRIARDYPEEVRPLIPRLTDEIGANDPSYQAGVLSTLGGVTAAYPAAAAPAVPALRSLVDSPNPRLRTNALGLLADVASGDPAAIEPHVEPIGERLGDEFPSVRANAATAILRLGLAAPEAVEEAMPRMAALLEDPSPVVRRIACKAFGRLAETPALDRLERIAATDPDERVRAAASQAIEQRS